MMTPTDNSRIAQFKQELQAARDDLESALMDCPENLRDVALKTTDDSWTVLQLGRHLLDVHYFQRRQLDAFLNGQATVSEDFDLDAFNADGQERLIYLAWDDVLDRLAASHKRLLSSLESIPQAKWDDTLWHFALRQDVTLEKYVSLVAFHERLHTQEIVQFIQARATTL